MAIRLRMCWCSSIQTWPDCVRQRLAPQLGGACMHRTQKPNRQAHAHRIRTRTQAHQPTHRQSCTVQRPNTCSSTSTCSNAIACRSTSTHTRTPLPASARAARLCKGLQPVPQPPARPPCALLLLERPAQAVAHARHIAAQRYPGCQCCCCHYCPGTADFVQCQCHVLAGGCTQDRDTVRCRLAVANWAVEPGRDCQSRWRWRGVQK